MIDGGPELQILHRQLTANLKGAVGHQQPVEGPVIIQSPAEETVVHAGTHELEFGIHHAG